MTNPTNALAEIQDAKKPGWWNLLLGLIAGLVVALLLAILAPFISAPSSAADLSNGTFCMHVVDDDEPEINATAGNCHPAPLPPRLAIDQTLTAYAPDPDLGMFNWFANVYIKKSEAAILGFYIGGKLTRTDSSPHEYPAPWRVDWDTTQPDPVFEICILDTETNKRSDCVRVDISNYLDTP